MLAQSCVSSGTRSLRWKSNMLTTTPWAHTFVYLYICLLSVYYLFIICLLSVCLFIICLFVCLFAYLFICLFVYLLVCYLLVYLFICLFVYLFICLFVYLLICLFLGLELSSYRFVLWNFCVVVLRIHQGNTLYLYGHFYFLRLIIKVIRKLI